MFFCSKGFFPGLFAKMWGFLLELCFTLYCVVPRIGPSFSFINAMRVKEKKGTNLTSVIGSCSRVKSLPFPLLLASHGPLMGWSVQIFSCKERVRDCGRVSHSIRSISQYKTSKFTTILGALQMMRATSGWSLSKTWKNLRAVSFLQHLHRNEFKFPIA
jgi:hypothetical protein